MKKKRTIKEIAFNEEGMRSFNSVNEAIQHFAHEINDVRKIVKMFSNAHEVKFGFSSFNVSRLKLLSGSQRKAEIKKMINSSAEHAVRAFELEFDKWLNRFHSEVVEQVVEQIIEPVQEIEEQPNEDLVNDESLD